MGRSPTIDHRGLLSLSGFGERLLNMSRLRLCLRNNTLRMDHLCEKSVNDGI